jgi:hypothetical protein
VDNSEVLGVLSDAAITEADVDAGRWDGAAVELWAVNWADVAARRLMFRGTLGEIERAGVGFRAELRGLAEALNQPQGFVYQGPCSAVLGDARCRVDLSAPGMALEAGIIEVVNARTVRLAPAAGFAGRWFERGRLRFLSGGRRALRGSSRQTGRPTRGASWNCGRKCGPRSGREMRSASRPVATGGPRPAGEVRQFHQLPGLPAHSGRGLADGVSDAAAVERRREPQAMSPAVEIARGWIGTPYLHQASRRGAGADCLGLVRGRVAGTAGRGARGGAALHA